MAVIETLLTFGMGYLLAGGKSPLEKLTKTKAKKSGNGDGLPPVPPGPPITPSKVPWPEEKKEAVKEAEARHAAEQTKFNAQLAEARAKAAGDAAAQADINRRARERQKALDDMKRDIEEAKRS